MMNDRELLELAANAAGIEGAYKTLHRSRRDHFSQIRHFIREAFVSKGLVWDPLNDDGDAFRLAYALQMDVDYRSCRVVFGDDDQTLEFLYDGSRGVRRAITQAAAEIGKSMEGK